MKILGAHPFKKGKDGKVKYGIGTIYPDADTIISGPGIHVMLRERFLDEINKNREEPLDIYDAVDYNLKRDCLCIRTLPDDMDRTLRAIEVAEKVVDPWKVTCEGILDQRVRAELEKIGRLNKLHTLPKGKEEKISDIADSKREIGCGEIYYHNTITGTRWLTYEEFCKLDNLEEQLAEIKEYAVKGNPRGYPEVSFFGADFSISNLFKTVEENELVKYYSELKRIFERSVDPALKKDDYESDYWVERMGFTLVSHEGCTISEGDDHGLCLEYKMPIKWLPGARFKQGGMILAPELNGNMNIESNDSCDEKVLEFISNFHEEYGEIEHINIGSIVGSQSKREHVIPGRRDVYIAPIKIPGKDEKEVKIIRMQRWDVCEFLKKGKSLAKAREASEKYAKYVKARRKACRQLGMKFPEKCRIKTISEIYKGHAISSTYFERDYIDGIATDKIPASKYEDRWFSFELARLLGRAAASNMIVGRVDDEGSVLFDDGDEVWVEGNGLIVASHTGSFGDCETNLENFVEAYAAPVKE
ncbi:MAG: hypothetical protein V3V78_04185, partial [Candidatus Woesearchaeota archaeon]